MNSKNQAISHIFTLQYFMNFSIVRLNGNPMPESKSCLVWI